jgi:hypothetical protein
MSDITVDATVQERLQLLLAEKEAKQRREAEIDREIAALLPSSTSFHQHRTANNKQFQLHPRDAPRSIPATGATMARHLSSVGPTLWSSRLAPL